VHRYGVIIPSDSFRTAVAAGVDYVEPTIVGNLLVERPRGDWVRNPDYVGPESAPSFAILFPPAIRLSDPAFPMEEIARYLEAAMSVIASAAEPGAKIVFGSGGARRIPDAVDREIAEARFADVVVAARDVAARNDLRVMLEPLNRGETNLLFTIRECAAFLDAHGIDGVPIVADLYHLMLEGEPFAAITENGPRIGHAHIADTGRKGPGTGDWPLADFLATLRAAGYDGTVSIECNWTSFADEFPPALAHLRTLEA
jgi:sugar phosphate isomerase/epimerase